MFQKFLNKLKTPENQSLIESIQKGYQACFEDVHDYYEIQQEKMNEIVGDIIHAKKGEIQPWYPIPIDRIKKIWTDFMTQGVIRDEKGLNKISHAIVERIAMLHVNTELGGHTPHDPKENYESYLERELSDAEMDKLDEKSSEYLVDENGQYRLSDYGLEPLVDLAIKLTDTTESKETIMLIDRVLNVVHQRSDLASMFIQGGRMALDELQGEGVLTESKHYDINKLKKNKIPLTDEERKEVFKKDAVWAYASSIDPNTGKKVQKVSAVWKAKDLNSKDIIYVTNTHRAANTAKSLNAIINKYHNFIKGTA